MRGACLLCSTAPPTLLRRAREGETAGEEEEERPSTEGAYIIGRVWIKGGGGEKPAPFSVTDMHSFRFKKEIKTAICFAEHKDIGLWGGEAQNV